jgi:single-stranded-DNA-specific exonuclease
LCSAGVAFYLCAALRTRLARTEAGRLPDPRGWLDLVAVATICDMMPLREENRVLVHSGLRHLGQRSRPGLRALLRVAGVDPKVRIDEEHVGYKLGPRLNAPGRLGTAAPALRLLRARTEAEAEPLAEQIEVLNARRRRHTEQTVAEALAILAVDPSLSRRAGIVVAHEGWLPGIVGIAAAGICEHHRRPTLVLAVDPAIGMARGSVRSHGGIDVRAALSACAGLLLRFGGHREAAGVSLEAHRVPELAEAFDAAVAQQQGEDAQGAGSGEEEVVDAILPFEVIDTELCDAVRILAPYGMGFETPRFASEDLVVERVRILKERHLALTVSQGGVRREAIGFGLAFHALQVGETIGCIHVPFLDHYRGDTRLRLQVERLWRSNSC